MIDLLPSCIVYRPFGERGLDRDQDRCGLPQMIHLNVLAWGTLFHFHARMAEKAVIVDLSSTDLVKFHGGRDLVSCSNGWCVVVFLRPF